MSVSLTSALKYFSSGSTSALLLFLLSDLDLSVLGSVQLRPMTTMIHRAGIL